MSIAIPFISENFKTLRQFLKSTSFTRAILVGIAITVPIVMGLQLGYFEIGLAICFGAFLSSSCDVSGSFRHKKNGILISAALVMIVSFIKGHLHFELWLLLSVLGVLTFAIAYISIYGFRASLVSFSGLMALVLSFANDLKELEIYQYVLLIGVGGLWYLLLAKIWYRIYPEEETEELLSETYLLTAEFIETRAKLVGPHVDYEELQSKLLHLQSELTENHEVLREILILSKKNSGWSHYEDNRLLVFVQLVEMLETAIANPVNYDRMDALFDDHPNYIKIFQILIFKMSDQLRMISEAGNKEENLPGDDDLSQSFENARVEIASLRENPGYEEYLMLQTWLEYQEKQFKKIKKIKWLLGSPRTAEIEVIDRNDAKRFVASQDYDPKLLVRNFSFKSTIFRHSIRLAVTVMIGYALGSIFAFQNPYSILFILIITMRPNYGLTKSRAKDRIIGTLIGGAVAAGLVFLIQNPYVYGTLGVVSLVIALSMLQKNYRAAATFITLSVVFIYAILSPDILTVIQFRIMDTVVGAGLSIAALLWLWPTWEFVEIKSSIKKSVKANKDFLHKITEYYQQKGNLPTAYNIARKEAFLATSSLSSAFQRMAQEPKSKQRGVDNIYDLVVLNHTFLASLASLSTYIQHHKTTEASERFKMVTEKIEKNLEQVLQCLKGRKGDSTQASAENDTLLEEQIPTFISLDFRDLSSKDKRDLQEAHLVWGQLQWLLNISGEVLKMAASLKVN